MSGKQVQMKIKMWHFGDQALLSAPGYKDELKQVGETTSPVQREPRVREPSLKEDKPSATRTLLRWDKVQGFRGLASAARPKGHKPKKVRSGPAEDQYHVTG